MSHMAISRIDKEFLKFFSQLEETQKKPLLTMLKAFLKTSDSTKTLSSLEQYNSELKEAMEQINNGEIYTHDEVIKLSKGW
ncbi:hypothetical protein [Flavihumibacter fluvii]|uniref:hypothetical protein n=1 Tax=Flavihumibacter fluvii TaxID=2838157 RepID=UPI001BDF5EE8|nr:hypothetical protein [Flavihumibacter fluvii]ULQ51491.1 hypothetical protein KJS93_15490 [Flavihumibacter fluvii]